MRSADNIEKLVKNLDLGIDTNAQTDQAVLRELLDAQTKSMKQQPAYALPNIRRTIMKSPITKLAAAAMIIIACLTGLFLLTSTGSGIALADVLARIEQVKAYRYQTSLTTDGESASGESMNFENHSTTWISRDYGSKTVTETIDPNTGAIINTEEKYVLPQEKVSINLFHKDKQYTRKELDETRIEEIQKENNDPRNLIKEMLNYEHTSLEKSVVDGKNVEGFQVTLPDYYGGTGESVQCDVQLWVDVKTWLPVKVEMGATYRDIPAHLLFVVNQYQWDIMIDATQFKPVIPADYTLRQTQKGLPKNEETALNGLKLFADTMGYFPKSPALIDLISELGKFVKSDEYLKDLEGLSKDESKQRYLELFHPFLGFGGFYIELVKEKKEPVYHGNIVTPEDSDQVLMRWKVSDNQYRVIFGNLHAETVTAETLAELEKLLPE